MLRVKQTIQPMMDGIKNNDVPIIVNPQAGFGSLAAKIKVLPQQKQHSMRLMSNVAVNNTTSRQHVPCVKLGVNVLRTAPIDGLNQQAPQGIARNQLRGFQSNLQGNLNHNLNGQIMPTYNNFNVALTSSLGGLA